MANTELEQLDRQGMSAWEKQDAGAFVSLFADNFTWRDWTLPEPMKDKEAARNYFNAWITAFPNMRIKQLTRVVGDDSVAAEIEFTGTNSGPMVMGGNEIPPTNKYVVGRGTYFARYQGGKIVSFSTHPDVAGMMMQMGMMPAT